MTLATDEKPVAVPPSVAGSTMEMGNTKTLADAREHLLKAEKNTRPSITR